MYQQEVKLRLAAVAAVFLPSFLRWVPAVSLLPPSLPPSLPRGTSWSDWGIKASKNRGGGTMVEERHEVTLKCTFGMVLSIRAALNLFKMVTEISCLSLVPLLKRLNTHSSTSFFSSPSSSLVGGVGRTERMQKVHRERELCARNKVEEEESSKRACDI